MCLAIPGKVVGIDRSGPMLMGTVDFGGIRKEVCLEWVPGVVAGEYVVVHVGFAISTMDEEEALRSLDIIRQMEGGLDELGAGADPPAGPGPGDRP